VGNRLLFGLSAIALTVQSGCITVQAIEPVQAPPVSFQDDVLTRIEFMHPTQIGLRCSERGAEFLGMPALSAGGCADRNLITMIDPCKTFTAGRYAAELCQLMTAYGDLRAMPGANLGAVSYTDDTVISAAQTLQSAAQSMPSPSIRIDFVSADEIAFQCRSADGNSPIAEGPLVCRVGDRLVASNPCTANAPSWYERTLCHEIGHVNGWPSNHPASKAGLRLAKASASPEALSFAANAQSASHFD